MYVFCCRFYQASLVFKIIPTRKNVAYEFAFYLKKCLICGKPVLKIVRFNKHGDIISFVYIKQSKIGDFIKNMVIISRIKTFSAITNRGKHYLRYNRFGKILKCFQNLRSMKIGIIDGDPLAGLAGFMRSKLSL